MPLITERNSPFIALCTDDRNPLDIAEEGHLDYMIRTSIALGAAPLAIYRAASISAAKAFGLQDRGLVAPGWRADLVILDSLEVCTISDVVSAGRLVNDKLFATRKTIKPVGFGSVKSRSLKPADFVIAGDGKSAPVIGVTPGKIITEYLSRDLPSRNGEVHPDLQQDVIKVSVIERHG